MAISREQILNQNQKDKEHFASMSILVRDALDAQATVALDTWNDFCVVHYAALGSHFSGAGCADHEPVLELQRNADEALG
jgi:hypothetical protein